MSYATYVFWFTLKQAGLAVLVTVPLGALMARALVWNHTWGPARLCLKFLGLPLITPVIVCMLGFITLFGELFNIYTLEGIILAHVVFSSPFVALFMINAWRFIPEEHYRLAAQLHFSSRDIFYFIEAPQLRKPLLEISWICFCLFLNSFTLIMILGGGPQKTTLSMALYQYLFFFYDLEEGFKFASLQFLLTLSLAVVTIAFKVAPSATSLKIPSLPNLTSPFQKPVVLVTLLIICLPLIAVIFPSLHVAPKALQQLLLWQALAKSLELCLVIGPLSVVFALILVATQSPLAKPISALYFLLPPAFIGSVLFFLSLQTPNVSSGFFIGIMQIFYIIPFVYRLLESPSRTINALYTPTALSLGLSRFQRFCLIEWPLLKKPLATSLGLSCALSVGNFASFAFFEAPETPGLTSLLYQQISRFFDESLVTACVLLVLCYFLYQLPHWILRIHDRTLSA